VALLNPYFNVRGIVSEQSLIDDLIVECIKINGMKVYYVPRTFIALDPIFGEDPLSKFTKVFPIEMYFDNPIGFSGDRDLITKFGLELRDKANFIVSRRRFNQVVRYDGSNTSIPTTAPSLREVRPMEGDLIYLPLTSDLFEIRFADHESVFYQSGARYIWRITVEKFAYSSETIQTGVPEIDKVQQLFQNNNSVANDLLSDNANIKTGVTDVGVFTENNPFGEPEHE
jgi:hypothetical protein